MFSPIESVVVYCQTLLQPCFGGGQASQTEKDGAEDGVDWECGRSHSLISAQWQIQQ